MSDVVYVQGDVTAPLGNSARIIGHCCNDSGRWGRGFVTALSRRWSGPEAAYRDWYRRRGEGGSDFALGACQLVAVEDGLWVANMIGQHGIARRGRADAPLRYDALATALQHLAAHSRRLGASVHLPRIGAGLAGGTWQDIEALLHAHLTGKGIAVTVYDLR